MQIRLQQARELHFSIASEIVFVLCNISGAYSVNTTAPYGTLETKGVPTYLLRRVVTVYAEWTINIILSASAV